MARRNRDDGPGVWHHVVNRGVARRPVFEQRADTRFFLAQVAQVHRKGLLECYAYCLMVTHFHLLVRSPAGQLSEAMRLLQNGFVRWFNRSRRRDGPLFRGRFLSRPIRSETYWWTVFRYIHENPVAANIVERAEEYPHSSARHLATPGEKPRWLSRASRGNSLDAFTGCSDAERSLVERRLASAVAEEDPLDTLVGGAPSMVRAWMKRKAELADDTRLAPPLVTPGILLAVLDGPLLSDVDRPNELRGTGADSTSDVLCAGLLREVCGLTLAQIASILSCSISSAHRRHSAHLESVRLDERYADMAAGTLTRALGQMFSPAPTLGIPIR